jgi:hypothetical protein
MSTFNAKDAVQPLVYDFAPFHDAKGTVPEPTDDQVADFYAGLGRHLIDALGAKVDGVDMTDPEAVGNVFAGLDGDDHRKLYDNLLDLHAAVCSGQPDREAIAALPFRLRRAWYGMVQGWLRPEALTPATSD